MSFVRIWVHAVWGTKCRHPFLVGETKAKILQHIVENARSKQILIDCINGHTEHLHCLLSLNSDMGISKAMPLIKGESSFWINKNRITRDNFEWADEYYAASVSESELMKVRLYIINQEEHHRKKSFPEELEKFFSAYPKSGAQS
jgi:putative transposase